MSLRTRFAAAALAWTLPFSAGAASVMLTAEDTIAGLGTDITVQNGPAQSSVTLVMESPAGTSQTLTVQTDAKGHGTVSLPGSSAQRAGVYRISLREAAGADATFQVAPDTMDTLQSDVFALSSTVSADGTEEVRIVVLLKDRYRNPLPGRPATLLSSRSEDSIIPLTRETDDHGEQEFALSTSLPGIITLRAVDLLSAEALTDTATVQAEDTRAVGGNVPTRTTRTSRPSSGQRMYYAQLQPYDIIDHFEIEVAEEVTPEVEENLTIIVVDRNGNTVEDYVGTILFSSTDPEAEYPAFGRYTFKDFNLGEKTFALGLTFKTPGNQTLRVEDANDPSITGEVEIHVLGDTTVGAPITITSHQDNETVSTPRITLEGTGPKFAQLVVMGGAQDIEGATDSQGRFSIQLDLPPSQRDITIQIQTKDGKSTSDPLHLTFDTTGPDIREIAFGPSQPAAGEKVLVSVLTEPDLPQVLLEIAAGNGIPQSVTLTEDQGSDGVYKGFFTAPGIGSYQPTVAAMDKAGNVTRLKTQLTVGPKTLPTVQNVRADGKLNTASISWDPVDADIEHYRIYVGKNEENFTEYLDTTGDATQTVVKGLDPATTYYFAVTAVREDVESKEKSEVVRIQTLGLTLDIIEGNSSLIVSWEALPGTVPLSTYLLEYGTEPGDLTEKRIVLGTAKTHTLRDLFNGVTYHLRLTPVTVTGDKLEDLVATGQGTPSGQAGFHPAASDPIPYDLPSTPPPTPPAHNPVVGIPNVAFWFAGILAIAGILWHWQRRRAFQQAQHFLRVMEQQYHN